MLSIINSDVFTVKMDAVGNSKSLTTASAQQGSSKKDRVWLNCSNP